jgi:serine/threonine-protein kinase
MPAGITGTLLAGRYRTIERVGSGGMAVVLLAEDERLGRHVAVKRLHAQSPEDTARRFRREARLGASLNHPNLVSVYDIVTDEEGVLIVMEYVDGETLAAALARGPLPSTRAIEVLRGLAAALDHAHDEGIVHRDVKPANVLLGRDGRVKLADLGIATAVEGTRITMSGTVLGTAAYMAPEQLEGHNPGPAADVYSLAVVAWEALSGRRAYEGQTPLAIAHRKTVEPPPSFREAWPDAPPAVVEVLARAMGPDPRARPATASAFVAELATALDPARGERSSALLGVPPAAHSGAPPAPPAPPAARVRQPVPASSGRWTLPPPTPYGRRPARRAWLAPLVALLLVVAIGAVAVSVLGGGGSSSNAPRRAASSAKKSTPAGTTGQPSAPTRQAPTPPTTTAYHVPQPTGNDPAAGQRLNAQGKALSDAGNYSQAIPVLERSVQSFPAGTSDINYAYALYNLGHALRMAGRPADAVPVLEARLANPDQRATVQQELDAARAAAGRG